MSPRIRVPALAALLCTLAAAPAFAAVDFTVNVDAREVARGLLHVTQSFPGRSGTVSLSYPRWIPGEHGPTGPTVDVSGLVVRAGGKVVPWRRDLVDMQTIRVDVPSGAKSVDVAFDFLLDNGTEGFTSAACATPNLLLLSWNEVAFYPTGGKSDALRCEASLTLPDHWQTAPRSSPAPRAAPRSSSSRARSPRSWTRRCCAGATSRPLSWRPATACRCGCEWPATRRRA
jgi:hypothetical protein